MRRILLPSPPPVWTYTTPGCRPATRPVGALNAAMATAPSTHPGCPEPARVVTSPELTLTSRMRWLPLSVT